MLIVGAFVFGIVVMLYAGVWVALVATTLYTYARKPSSRWLPLLWFSVAMLSLWPFMFGAVFTPTTFEFNGHEIDKPRLIEGLGAAAGLAALGSALISAMVTLLVSRLGARRANGTALA